MFANDRNGKGVAGAFGVSLSLHVIVLLIVLTWMGHKKDSMKNYMLTEITFLEQVSEPQKQMEIEKPKSIMDLIKQAIPVKAFQPPGLTKPSLPSLPEQAKNPFKPAALDMGKSAAGLKPNLKTLSLDNEIGRTKLQPMETNRISIDNKNPSLQANTGRINLNQSNTSALKSGPSGIKLALTDNHTALKTSGPVPIKQTPVTVNNTANSAAVNIPKKEALLIQGDVAGRKIIRSEKPAYPRWLQEAGITASVTISFSVAPDGSVKKNAMVYRTSGYPELDSLAIDALMGFKFEALPTGGDQGGYATFRFELE